MDLGCQLELCQRPLLIVSFLTVNLLILGRLIENPIPTPFGAAIVPLGETVTGGSIMSSSQYLELAETSPGKVNPASVAMAMLWARPIPDSSMPPHQSGMLLSRQMLSTS